MPTPQTFYLRRAVADPQPLLAVLGALNLPVKPNLHTTLIYSTTPVDWDLPVFTPEDGALDLVLLRPRLEAFGPGKALMALVFDQPILSARHHALLRFGARSDWSPYQPHITLGPVPDRWQARSAHVPLPTQMLLGPETRRTV